MKLTDDSVLYVFILILVILCAGEPDMLDAIIAYINRQ
jgi:hypothetical protein